MLDLGTIMSSHPKKQKKNKVKVKKWVLCKPSLTPFPSMKFFARELNLSILFNHCEMLQN